MSYQRWSFNNAAEYSHEDRDRNRDRDKDKERKIERTRCVSRRWRSTERVEDIDINYISISFYVFSELSEEGKT